jgi:uncharacterized membrane protein YfcA
MQIIYLSLVSFFAWIVSTLAGGGSPFVLIPLVNLLMGAASVPPVITIGMFLGNAHRILLFWRDINWELTMWYAPGAIVGSFLGAYTFTQIHLDWLQLIIGIFLIISAVLFALEQTPAPVEADLSLPIPVDEPKFKLKAWYIMPAGFFKAFVSGLVGTTGPVLNPFYLRYGLVKEQLLATKATHVVIIHLVKIITYSVFAALSRDDVIAGLAIGLAAIPANLIGKMLLSRMSPHQFRQIVLAFMAVGGIWMLWGQRDLFLNLL